MVSSRKIRAVVLLALSARSPEALASRLPFGPGERATFRITYAHVLAGRATLMVEKGTGPGRLSFVAEARSQGFFAWLFRFHVDDRTVASWDATSGCSLGIEKHLREGRAAREQTVRFDPGTGTAEVRDAKIREPRFETGGCALDVLSAFFVTRQRGVVPGAPLSLPVFDNGKQYRLAVRYRRRERLDLPEPLGRDVATVVVEPMLVEGTGLFVKEGRLEVWLTDDERHIPVRMRSKVAVGSVSADLEAYTPE